MKKRRNDVSALDIKNLSHSYGCNQVLENVSFSVKKGEFFIIIGPNGSGKTTLMKLICGLSRFSSGSVSMMGRDTRKMKKRTLYKTLAYVPQFLPGDFPFTVHETVMMGRTPHQGFLGLPSEEDVALACRAMEFTDVMHLSEKPVDLLSGGEKQRVSIARAICQEPGIILLDEPTASLDVAHQIMVMDLMERLKEEQGVSVVMVSHDINLASLYADRMLLMKSGRVLTHGTPESVLVEDILEPAYGCSILVNRRAMGKYSMVMPRPGKVAL